MPQTYTPVRSRRGRVVHAVSMHEREGALTLCARDASGWAVALEPVNCRRCLARIAA